MSTGLPDELQLAPLRLEREESMASCTMSTCSTFTSSSSSSRGLVPLHLALAWLTASAHGCGRCLEPQLEHDLQTFKTSFPVKSNLLVYLVSNRPLLNPRLKEPLGLLAPSLS